MLRLRAKLRTGNTTYKARKQTKLNGLQALEVRQLLSISPGSDALKDQAAAAFVGPPDPSDSAVIVAQAPADADRVHIATAAAGKQSPKPAAAMQYVGRGSGSHGGTVTRNSTLSAASTASKTGGGAGAARTASCGTESITVGKATAPEDGVVRVPVTVSGVTSGADVSWSVGGQDTSDFVTLSGMLHFAGDGKQTVVIDLKDDGPPDEGNLQIDTFQATISSGPTNSNTVTITDPGLLDKECNCSCGCNNTEASTGNNGGTDANSGQGNAPQNLKNESSDTPHPIVSVNDTLTNAANDASVVEQTSLYDLSTSTTPLWTGASVYYNPANYTGQPGPAYTKSRSP